MQRRLAFVRALALVTLVACEKKEDIDEDSPKKPPKPKPTATATVSATTTASVEATAPCPESLPKEGEPCAAPKSGACTYPKYTRCTCTISKVWSCEQDLPVKGPLPPPDLPASGLTRTAARAWSDEPRS